MFFSISKILIFLIDPLFYILLFAFLGVLHFKKRRLPFLCFLAIYLVSTPIFSNQAMYILEHLEESSYSSKNMYDAVVVLSGMVNISTSKTDSIEFSGAVDRILTGVRLIREGKADRLVISGGTGRLFQTDQSEAKMLGAFAKKSGIPEQRILLDTTSRNTYQNAVNTRKIIEEENLKRIVLVTSAFHMYRSNGCFKGAGIEADLLPVDFNASLSITDFRDFIPSSGALNQSSQFIHEIVGIIMYGISGKAEYF